MDPNCAEDLPFENRTAAGAMLGRHLFGRCWPASTVVLALPRGGVPVGRAVASILRLPFEVLSRDCSPAGKTVLLVDDGLCTGATMRAALSAVRTSGAMRLIVAVPVGSEQAIQHLAGHADEVICLYRPEPFQALGMYYADFTQPKELRAAA